MIIPRHKNDDFKCKSHSAKHLKCCREYFHLLAVHSACFDRRKPAKTVMSTTDNIFISSCF